MRHRTNFTWVDSPACRSPSLGASYDFRHQRLGRDELPYCDQARGRQQRVYEFVGELHALIVRLEGRNFALINTVLLLSIFKVGDEVWVYNTAATIRQEARKNTDDMIFKAKVASSWIGPLQVLSVGRTSASASPDERLIRGKLCFVKRDPAFQIPSPSFAYPWPVANPASAATPPPICPEYIAAGLTAVCAE